MARFEAVSQRWSFLLLVALLSLFGCGSEEQRLQRKPSPRATAVVMTVQQPSSSPAPELASRVITRTQVPVRRASSPFRPRSQVKPEAPAVNPAPNTKNSSQARPAPEPPSKRSYPKASPRVSATPKNEPKPPVQVASNSRKPTSHGGSDGEVKVSSQVSWDSIPATGTGMNGHIEFEISPGPVKGKPERKRNLVVVLDVSGSMNLSLERIMTPVILLMERLHPEDRGRVVTFSDRARTFHPSTPMGTYRREVTPIMDSPRTDLLVGLEAAVEEIRKGRFQGREDQLVVLTDGLTVGPGGMEERPAHLQACLNLVRSSGIPVTVFGYGGKCDQVFLQSLARTSRGEFTYTARVSQLLESVMGDVIGLSGVITRNNRLVIQLQPDVTVTRAYLLGANGRDLGRPQVRSGRLEIPLGTLSEGETVRVALEVRLPNGQPGVLDLAQAHVEFEKADGKPGTTSPSKTQLTVSESTKSSRRNKTMSNVATEIQQIPR